MQHCCTIDPRAVHCDAVHHDAVHSSTIDRRADHCDAVHSNAIDCRAELCTDATAELVAIARTELCADDSDAFARAVASAFKGADGGPIGDAERCTDANAELVAVACT